MLWRYSKSEVRLNCKLISCNLVPLRNPVQLKPVLCHSALCRSTSRSWRGWPRWGRSWSPTSRVSPTSPSCPTSPGVWPLSPRQETSSLLTEGALWPPTLGFSPLLSSPKSSSPLVLKILIAVSLTEDMRSQLRGTGHSTVTLSAWTSPALVQQGFRSTSLKKRVNCVIFVYFLPFELWKIRLMEEGWSKDRHKCYLLGHVNKRCL